MSDIPKLCCDGFPFRNDDDATAVRVLLAALDPRPEATDAILNVLDKALAYSARYRETRRDVEAYDALVRAFSPLEVEEFVARCEEFARDHGDRMPVHRQLRRRDARRAPRANVFAPPDGQGDAQAASSSVAGPVSTNTTLSLDALASARIQAAAALRELRDGLDHQLQAEWLRAVNDAAAILVRAGRAKVTW